MLKSEPVRAVINETYDLLSQSIYRIEQKVPAELTAALKENVYRFSGCKTDVQLKEMNSLLRDDKGAIKPYYQFQQDALKINDKYNKTYLNTEYNYATGASIMAAKWSQIEEDGDEYWLQYRTANDGLVRPEHQALDGITLPPSDPFWDEFYPPNDWGCRCTVVQVLKEKYPLSNSQEAIDAGEAATAKPAQKIFRYNAGKQKIIFSNKHPYFKAVEKEKDAQKTLNTLANKNADRLVLEWAKAQESNRYEFENLHTGKMNLSSKVARQYFLPHTKTAEEKNVFISLAKNGNKLRFEKFEPLGIRKDTNSPKDVKNIEKKKNRGVVGYNVYSYNYNSKKWLIGFEIIDYKFEQPYYINKAKKP
jgi:SPP1 gp7 family putative phage head morphogenesis protein